MRTPTPDDEKKLKRLLKLLRDNGVTYFSDGNVSLALNDVQPEGATAIPFRQHKPEPEFPDLDTNSPEHLQVLMSHR